MMSSVSDPSLIALSLVLSLSLYQHRLMHNIIRHSILVACNSVQQPTYLHYSVLLDFWIFFPLQMFRKYHVYPSKGKIAYFCRCRQCSSKLMQSDSVRFDSCFTSHRIYCHIVCLFVVCLPQMSRLIRSFIRSMLRSIFLFTT